MKQGDREKLNQCLHILDTTDLGLSLVWLWTWSVVLDLLEGGDFDQLVSQETAWDELVKAIESGQGFSLEYGAEEHGQHVQDWMLENNLIKELD